jgi:colanic acid/amylovoran biosynthesis glycosyltransferase
MRIAFIVGRFPALSQTFILRQVTGLLERGHEVEIFAQRPGEEPVSHREVETFELIRRTRYLNISAPPPSKLAGLAKRARLLLATSHRNPTAALRSLNVIKFGRSALTLGVLRSVAPFFDRGPYDIVHCQFGSLGHLGLLLKGTGLVRGKLVVSFRGYDVSSCTKVRGSHIYGELFRKGDLFLCVSEHIRGKIIKLGCDPQKAIVHRSGAPMKKSDLPSSGPRNNGNTRIVSIARLVEKKGIEYGIQAVAKVLRRREDIDYHIVGAGPLGDGLQRLIVELNAEKNIKLLGWKTQADVVELLKSSDVLLAPSVTTEEGDEEGIPGVIMEAFTAGLPVVTTYHAGIPEVVKDGESGFLVSERDPDALAKALERLVEMPELRARMGRNGRRFVEEHCDIDKLNDRLVKIYRQLLDGELPSMSPQLQASSSKLPLELRGET